MAKVGQAGTMEMRAACWRQGNAVWGNQDFQFFERH